MLTALVQLRGSLQAARLPLDVPGADQVDLSDLAESAHRLNTVRLIDRNTVWELKREALERIWEVVRTALPGFEQARGALRHEVLPLLDG